MASAQDMKDCFYHDDSNEWTAAAYPHFRGLKGNVALKWAIAQNHITLAKALLTRERIHNHKLSRIGINEAILLAVKTQSIEMLIALAEQIETFGEGYEGYHIDFLLGNVAKEEHESFLRRLLQEDIFRRHLSDAYNYVLYRAISGNNTHVALYLLIFESVSEGLVEIMDEDLDDNHVGLSLFEEAIRTNNLTIIKALLAQINVENNIALFNNSALWTAISYKREAIIKLLLNYPSVLESLASDENAVLQIACATGNTELVQYLLTFPAVTQQLFQGQGNELLDAIKYGQIEIVNLLLGYGEVLQAISTRQYDWLALVHDAIHADLNGDFIRLAYLYKHVPVMACLCNFRAQENWLKEKHPTEHQVALTINTGSIRL